MSGYTYSNIYSIYNSVTSIDVTLNNFSGMTHEEYKYYNLYKEKEIKRKIRMKKLKRIL